MKQRCGGAVSDTRCLGTDWWIRNESFGFFYIAVKAVGGARGVRYVFFSNIICLMHCNQIIVTDLTNLKKNSRCDRLYLSRTMCGFERIKYDVDY